jgi:hypothetical protein
VQVAPGERQPIVLTFHPSEGDRRKGLVLELSPHDALAIDDVAYARVPPGQKQPVALVSAGGSPWLERALRSDPQVDLWKGPLAESTRAAAQEGALIVYDGVCPAVAPPGDALIVAPPAGNCLGVTVGAEVDRPAITSWSNGDPRLRFLTLDGVHIGKARALSVDSPSQSLVRSQKESLVADASLPGRSVTVVGFDVGESDWPLKASFVLFVRNLLELTRAHRAQVGSGSARTGEPLRVAVPAVLTQVKIEAPGSKPATAPARDGLAVISDTSIAGHYLVSWEGPTPGSALIPVNLTSEKETDLRGGPLAIEKQGATVNKASELADAHTDWSYLVAALALGLVALDAWWLTRRATPSPVLAPPRPERAP